jgi:integrase
LAKRQLRVDSMLAARILGSAIVRDDARWLSESPKIREKLERLNLISSGKIAVDWKIIDENPFCKVRTQRSTVKVNEFVPREVVDKLMKKANPVWKVILSLSRYGGLRTPSETLSLRGEDIDWEMSRISIPEPKVEHHEGCGIRSCSIFPELRPILDEAFEIFCVKSEYVVAAPQYRAAANTAMGWPSRSRAQ